MMLRLFSRCRRVGVAVRFAATRRGFASASMRARYRPSAYEVKAAQERAVRALGELVEVQATQPQVFQEVAKKLSMATCSELTASVLVARRKVEDQSMYAAGVTPAPTFQALLQVGVVAAVPMVAFGAMDNVIMIIAGEHIDRTLGVALSLSTMAAAGLGNAVSDVAGVGLGGVVEAGLARFTGMQPSVTAAQMELPISRFFKNGGQAVGIAVGCVIGMFPLLWFDDANEEKAAKKKAKQERV